MAVVARLLPRHWDGYRLLQFLTGLALIALAFATPRLVTPAEPAAPPITVITTVDTPAGPELPVAPATAVDGVAGSEIGRAPAGSEDGTGAAASAQSLPAHSVPAQSVAAGQTGPAQTGPTQIQIGTGHVTPVCVEARAALDGVAQSAHGVRGPPLI